MEITDPWQAVDQRLDAAALAPALRRALAELPVEEREVLLLVSWEQLSPPRRPPPWASRRAPPACGCTGHGVGCATGSQQHARPDGT